MKTRLLLPCALVGFFVTSSFTEAPGDPGTNCFFPASVIQAILIDSECAEIRFYNAEHPDGNGESLLAIGVDADGNELYSSSTKYQRYAGIKEGIADITATRRGKARTACERIGTASFNADFTRSDMQAMLDLEGATGILVAKTINSQSGGSGGYTITAQGASLNGADIVPVEGANVLSCTEPCPNVCGSSDSYLYIPPSE